MQTKLNTKWLFVLGAPKSGTTALFELLQQYELFCLPKIKEIHYFSREKEKESLYAPATPKTFEDYLKLFGEEDNSEKVMCDVSPSYLYDNDAVSEINEKFENIMGVVLVRHPVDRAYSHYQMDYQKGLVLVSLEKILKNPKKYHKFYEQYIGKSMYSQHLMFAEKVIGMDNFYVFTSTQLRDEPASILEKIIKHFDLPSEYLSDLESPKSNVTLSARNSIFRRLGSSITLNKIFALCPSFVKTRLLKIYYGKKRLPKISDHLRVELESLLSVELHAYNKLLSQRKK